MAPRIPVTTCDMVQELLNTLHNTYGKSFREIAKMSAFSPIPAGTLCAIAKGRGVPKRWHKRLGLAVLAPAPVCPKCGDVHVSKRCTAGQSQKKKVMRLDDYSRRDLREMLEKRKEFTA